CLHYYDTPLTF
nr:immunoglobulin light chain junction region [Macaca mulatta]MOW35129.1 immunoglobulin light chain junction region [Macaca mulatta]